MPHNTKIRLLKGTLSSSVRLSVFIILLLLKCQNGFSQSIRLPNPTDTVASQDISYLLPDADEADYSEYFDMSGYDFSYTENSLEMNLSFARYRPRGYDNRFTPFLYNDMELTDISDGYTYWQLVQGIRNIGNNYKSRVTVAGANRNYSQRIKYSGKYDIGKRGASVSLAIDRRWGRNGFVDGLFTDITTPSVIFEKKGERHNLNIMYTGAYGKQGVRGAATEEAFELTGNNYYNPYYGTQNGDKRNARQREYKQNMAVISYGYTINEKLILTSSFSSIFGSSSYSLPAWYDSPTPYPDYYRYMPSFFGNSDISGPLEEAWRAGDPSVTQTDWRRMYESNIFGDSGADGVRSHYIVKDLVSEKFNNKGILVLTVNPSRGLEIKAGISGRLDRTAEYSRLNDLLGGDYWLDIDQYMLYDEYYGDMTENNLRAPGRKVREGEKFGYDYNMHTSQYAVNLSVKYRIAGWNFNANALVGATQYQREGNYEKENFPGALSYGKSAKTQFNENNIDLSVSKSISLRHSLTAEIKLAETAPLVGDIFLSSQYRNALADDVSSIKFSSFGLNYSYISPVATFRVSGYYSKAGSGSDILNYYDDIESRYVTLALSGIDKVYAGAEALAEINITPKFAVTALLSHNVWKYDSDPAGKITDYTSGETVISNAKSYMSGYRLASGPQSVASASARYTLPAWWRISAAVNWAGDNYISPNPVRRMTRVTDLAASPEIRAQILDQEKLPDALTVNITLSKDFRFGNGHSLGLWVTLDNLLNNEDIRYTGYEQMRLRRTDRTAGSNYYPFPSKYLYAFGRNFYCSLSYTF